MLTLDLLSILLSFVVANIVRFGDPWASAGTLCAATFIPVYLGLAFGGKCYTLKVLESPKASVYRASCALTVTCFALLAVFFNLKISSDISRVVFGLGTVTAGVLLAVSRYAAGHIVGKTVKWNFVQEVLLVDGVAVLPTRGQIVVFADQAGLSAGLNDPGAYDRLGHVLRRCDRVILATKPEARAPWIKVLRGVGVDVEVLTPELDHLGALRLRSCEGQSSLLVSCGPLDVRCQVLKRTLDIAISLACILILSPIVIAIATFIKLTSAGPVLFRQTRIGMGNRLFEVLKFRTMWHRQSDFGGTKSTSRDDPRVTPVGKFLRRTSLDELPQLLNVLIGQMSIVGPRPHALASTAEDSLFWMIDERYWHRGAVKPGITGLAQVRGFRGATEFRHDLTSRVQSDLEYLENWGVWKDVVIMLRTVRVIIHTKAF